MFFGKFDLRFGFLGEGVLLFFFKVFYYDKYYFVIDMEKGCIMVYNEYGDFFWYFGSKDDEINGNGCLVLLIGMIFDLREGILLVCDWGFSFI